MCLVCILAPAASRSGRTGQPTPPQPRVWLSSPVCLWAGVLFKNPLSTAVCTLSPVPTDPTTGPQGSHTALRGFPCGSPPVGGDPGPAGSAHTCVLHRRHSVRAGHGLPPVPGTPTPLLPRALAWCMPLAPRRRHAGVMSETVPMGLASLLWPFAWQDWQSIACLRFPLHARFAEDGRVVDYIRPGGEPLPFLWYWGWSGLLMLHRDHAPRRKGSRTPRS